MFLAFFLYKTAGCIEFRRIELICSRYQHHINKLQIICYG